MDFSHRNDGKYNEDLSSSESKYSEDNFSKIKRITCKSVLYVIAVISNPARFARRYELFVEFCERMMLEDKVKLITVELQQGCREFVTNSTIKLRTTDEIWYKENLINIAASHLPSDWEYMAWIDADIEFQNKKWATETIELLQTYKVLQLFSHAIDLGPKQETLQVHSGFVYQYCNGEVWSLPNKYNKLWHPGYAWAITRKAYDDIGGLLDFGILGAGDHHMSLSFIGLVNKTLNKNLHEHYKLLCNIFQEICEKKIKRNIGFLHGTILHHFHGCKTDRKYVDRWEILVINKYDPLRDIVKNSSGLYRLTDEKNKLRDDIINYFRQRNEDFKRLTCDYKYVKKDYM